MVKVNKEFINQIITESYKDKIFWDDDLKGFGVRAQGKSYTYVLAYIDKYGKQKRFKICKIDKLTPLQARNHAKELFADIIKGNDPVQEKSKQKNTLTTSELCSLYLQEGTLHKKASTLYIDKGRIQHHIIPLIGNIPITEINRATIEKMMLDIIKGDKIRKRAKSQNKRGTTLIKGGEYAASRTVSLLTAILEFAKHRKLISENPGRGIQRPKDKVRDVFLSPDEITDFGTALTQAKNNLKNSKALNIILLLLLTGCRKNEIASLKWSYVDFRRQCFMFPDTKTGQQNRIFGKTVANILQQIKKEGSDWVFPATSGDGYFKGVQKIFAELKQNKKEDTGQPLIRNSKLCLHSLRHTFASIAAEMGYTELTIAGLLGHKLGGVTNHYSHNTDKNLITSADCVSAEIMRLLQF
ncbi:MAG: site-specific integrase [Azospirillum sp.]|nr:site-specific integrase [Azospirillum sp.]